MSTSSRAQAIALPPTPIATSAPDVAFEPAMRRVPLVQPEGRWMALRWQAIDLYENNVGMLLIAASQLFMTFMNISVKFLNSLDKPVPTLELVFVRMFITYCCSVAFMIIRKIPHAVLGPPEVRLLLIFRGVSGFFGLFGIYYSLKYLSLSDAVVLTFLSPTTTAIAGFLFLRETLSRREVFAGLLSLGGVVLIARPQALFGANSGDSNLEDPLDIDITSVADTVTSSQRLVAVGVAMLGVAGATGAYISLRAIGTRAHIMHSLTFFSSYSVIVSAGAMLVLRESPVVPTQWRWCALLAAVGVCGFIAQILLVMGLQRETASRGTLALYVQIIFASIFERILFNVTPSFLSLLGMTIIIGSGLYVVITKDKAPDAYKRVPQNAGDIEAHEHGDTAMVPSPVDLAPQK